MRERFLVHRVFAIAFLGVQLASSCGRSGPGFPPPCGPGVERRDCYQAGPLPLACDPAESLRSSIARLGPSHVTTCTSWAEDPGVPAGAWVVSVDGSGPASSEELLEFVRHTEFGIQGANGANVGDCCVSAPEPCIKLAIERCTTPLDQVVARISQPARSGALAGKGFKVSVRMGNTAGRCTDAALDCAPIPSDSRSPRYHPDGDRYLRGEPPASHDCRTDGDCAPGGCGQLCQSWLAERSVTTCLDTGETVGAFCGCVRGECRWFWQ